MPMRQTPYDLKSEYVVAVGASDENDDRVYFSDYGNTQVDLCPPVFCNKTGIFRRAGLFYRFPYRRTAAVMFSHQAADVIRPARVQVPGGHIQA